MIKENLASKIQSFKDTMGGTFIKPPKEKVDKFIQALKINSEALDYLKIKRNLSDETIAHFNLGYDSEKNAIAIPEYKRGELVNIKYRHLSDDAKGRYSQEKGGEVWVFNEKGIDLGQEKGGILIVEGQFDAMSAWQAGFKNVVSVSSGATSYSPWIDLLDNIPKVYIAFDNDKTGKSSAIDMAERIGTDKSFEIVYPEGIKDANDYFKSYTNTQYRELIAKAPAFYKYKFSGVTDVIESLRLKKDNLTKLESVPFIEFEEDWMVILSGTSNIGKTSYAMNIAKELTNKDIPTLVMPFERGIRTVGKRFLQVKFDKTQSQLDALDDSEWDKMIPEVLETPLYFSVPKREEIRDIVARAKKIFGVKFIIVDHLDYLVRKSTENHNVETSNTLQEFKALAQEFQIVFIIVHHIRKQDNAVNIKKPKMEDLKGSSSVYQDPEAVIMLSSPEKDQLEIDIVKNKGEMGSRIFAFNVATGVLGHEKGHIPKILSQAELDFNSF